MQWVAGRRYFRRIRELIHRRRGPLLGITLFSAPAWLIRLILAPRYIYMSFDQARDSFIFVDMLHGHWPTYGPLALAGGYNLPNYYYAIYYWLNITRSVDPVWQAAPFVFLSACGVTLALVLCWQLLGSWLPKLSSKSKLLLLSLPLIYVGFAYYDIINMPMIWNPMNLVFWQLLLFLLYLHIVRRRAVWKTSEALLSWSMFGALGAIAACLHGTYLYSIPLWLGGLLAVELWKKRFSSLACLAGGLLALLPYLAIDSHYGWANTKAMLRLHALPGSQPQPLQLTPLHNLWNTWQQFTQKVIFGLDQPKALWSAILLCLCICGLIIMIRVFTNMRWYVWWIAVYAAIASVYPGQLPPGIISWHYQQNLQLLPLISALCLIALLIRVRQNRSVRPAVAAIISVGFSSLLLCGGLFVVNNSRLIARHFSFAYGHSHQLMTTYEIKDAISQIPSGSRICVPVGYYHPLTYQYLAEHMLHRYGDNFTTDCATDRADYMIVQNYYYPFWPPHTQAIPTTNEPYIQPQTTLVDLLHSTPQYRIYRIRH